MAHAGLTPRKVLVAATSDAAACMDAEDVGTLRPGAWADLVVLAQDPLADVRNTKTVESVWIEGHRVPVR